MQLQRMILLINQVKDQKASFIQKIKSHISNLTIVKLLLKEILLLIRKNQKESETVPLLNLQHKGLNLSNS